MGAPPFIDAVHAAEMLHVSLDDVLDLVRNQQLHPIGGKPTNPFLRTSQVQSLVEERGADNFVGPARRVKSVSARIQTRLTADAKWSDIREEDIETWVARIDSVQRSAARKVATMALERLQMVLESIDVHDRK